MSIFALLRDVITYAHDPLTPHQAELSTVEEWIFFQHDERGKKEELKLGTPLPLKRFGVESTHSDQQSLGVLPTRPRTSSPKAENPIQKWPAIKGVLERIVPAMILHETTPENEQAEGRVDVVILLCCSSEKARGFVGKLSEAIEKHLGKVKVVQLASVAEEDRWEPFFSRLSPRLVVTTERVEEISSSIPCLILSPVETYEVPAQKAVLWRTLCQHLKR